MKDHEITNQSSECKEYIANGDYWFDKISRAHDALIGKDYGLCGVLLGEMRMELIYLRTKSEKQNK